MVIPVLVTLANLKFLIYLATAEQLLREPIVTNLLFHGLSGSRAQSGLKFNLLRMIEVLMEKKTKG